MNWIGSISNGPFSPIVDVYCGLVVRNRSISREEGQGRHCERSRGGFTVTFTFFTLGSNLVVQRRYLLEELHVDDMSMKNFIKGRCEFLGPSSSSVHVFNTCRVVVKVVCRYSVSEWRTRYTVFIHSFLLEGDGCQNHELSHLVHLLPRY